MSEQVNESISALMDDEANELDLRRILNEAADSRGPQQQMRRYQLLRSALQKDPVSPLQLDLSASIAASIDTEDAPAVASPWLKPLGGFAVAASVAAIVVVGSQGLFATKAGTEPASAAPQYAQNAAVAAPSLAPSTHVRAVANGRNTEKADQAYQRRAFAQQQQRVNAYMQIHARNASMNDNLGAVPLARAASYQVR